MRTLCLSPLFLVGLLLRLIVIVTLLPLAVTTWYEPFLTLSITEFTTDPWELWIAHGGDAAAFPYGYVMWLAFLPAILLFKFVGIPLVYGHGVTLLAIDFSLLVALRKLCATKRNKLLLIVYWLSPIVMFATYVVGANDLLPVLLLVLSLNYMKSKQLFWAGLFSIAAISAKFSMVIALPFFSIYMFRNKAIKQLLPEYIKGALIMFIASWLPFFLSESGLSMVFNNPLMTNIYQFSLNIGDKAHIYLVPLIYLVILYSVWIVKRLNFELFDTMLGIAFLLVVLMSPNSPGWFVWIIPLLVTYQISSDKISVILIAAFSMLYVFNSLFLLPDVLGPILTIFNINSGVLDGYLSGYLSSLGNTAKLAIGIILVMRIWRDTIKRNDYFRLSRKPFVIGISGDSGSGKDTFSDAISGLFGGHSVVTLSGDDYHLWDRKKPMWQVMTHLNPMANDLESFATDLVALTNGKSISSKHYNHQTGLMGRPTKIASKDIVIASGLHALYWPIFRTCYDLSIYLDIDEGLRRHFKLQRDVHQRGHSIEKVLADIDKRKADSEHFIKPQASYADIVLSLQPIHPRILENVNNTPLRYKLLIQSRHGFNEHSLLRVLVGVCGLHVDMVTCNDAPEIELTIEGETSADDVALAAQMICPRMSEFLDISPEWQDGILGLMQLITLSHIDQALTKRFIQ